MAQELFFEDFYVGQTFLSVGSAKVTAEEIKEFGQKYDPQPFHLDEAAGEGSFFKGLAASGWLTAAASFFVWGGSHRWDGGSGTLSKSFLASGSICRRVA